MVVPESRRTSRTLESVRIPVDSMDFRHLNRGKPLNKSWNGPEDTAVPRRSPDLSDPNLADAKKKKESMSFTVEEDCSRSSDARK
ncbi:uncharacterized protein A4U43_C07F12940 [Asparagus officinalis]|uniref:Uncharacterized protein n=1 Tax=Asparagus officinalis TaxID=4686 RepID=A0A5P1EEW9_ASPOF|nr:uncharacterized protein A4U43_C07F12940 [Asparagus officinalis]